jgi:hypothetical protein
MVAISSWLIGLPWSLNTGDDVVKIDQDGKARVPASRGGRKNTDGDQNEGVDNLR